MITVVKDTGVTVEINPLYYKGPLAGVLPELREIDKSHWAPSTGF